MGGSGGRAVTGELVAVAACLVVGVTGVAYCLTQWSAVKESFAQFVTAAAVLAVVWAVVRARAFARTVGGRQMVVRTHGGHGTKLAARHEGGHVAMVKRAGGRVLSARIYPDGSGLTRFKLPPGVPIADVIAIDVAGEVAAGTSQGCESDQEYMRAALAALPPAERAAARREGYARASNAINGLFGDAGVSATASRLLRDGRI